MTLSGRPELEFQAEVFVRSLEMSGKVDYCLTICQGDSDQLRSPLLKGRAEVVKFPHKWHSALGCVPEKGDITVYTDADIMIWDNISRLETLCKDKIGGVIAYSTPGIIWKDLFGDEKWEKMYDHPLGGRCPYYLNLGFVAVPSKYVRDLNKEIPEGMKRVDEIYPSHYHRPQLALCLAVERLKLPRTVLPPRWNVPDMFPDLWISNPAVVHLLMTKSLVKSWRGITRYSTRNEAQKSVQNQLKRILTTLAI